MASTDWLFGDVTEQSTAPAEATWSNLGNLLAEDDVYATVNTNPTQAIKWFRISDFDIGDVIPVGSTIDGIEFRFSAKTSTSTLGIADVFLVDPDTGNQVGDDKGSGTITTTEQFFLFGGAADKWGWTDVDRTQLASVNFKVHVKLNTPAFSGTVSADSGQVKIHYSPPPSSWDIYLATLKPVFFTHLRM